MDFGTLLSKAQKNGQGSKKEIKYYSTKFEPPKKEQRSKTLSVNIQKFLARKEQEEKQKTNDANKRRDQLLELRSKDKKATRRVNVMLKRTKSANQSVIQDAVDSDNTAITLAGACQPDEDDYGYVSQSASEFYNKMMEKYSKMPDEPKFSLGKKKVSTNLSSTKDRVRAALEKEKEEANQPHRRKRKRENSDVYENDKVEEKREEKKEVKKPHLKAAPVINFSDLLKLAEKKQFEPIVVEQKKDKDEERLLTKKQKREAEREKEIREAKEKREQARLQGVSAPSKRIPKLGEENKSKTNGEKPPQNQKPEDRSKLRQQLTKPTEERNGKKPDPKKIPSVGRDAERRDSSSAVAKVRPEHQSKPKEFPPRDLKKSSDSINRTKQVVNGQKPKQFPPSDLKPKQFPPSDIKPKQFPPRDLKEKRFPSQDVRRKPKPIINKGRFYDDDSEYDSEMDDFIDDGPEEDEDYSKHISEIFGYDKRKYSHLDDDVDNMESTFAQQMREEVISTKMGIREDLEDMKMEEEHKKRKAIMKKKYR